LDSDDAEYYNEQIKHLETESEDINLMMKQQLSIVKASLGTVNSTISDIEYNNQVIREGVTKLKNYVEKFTTDTEAKLNILEIKVTVDGHIARVYHAMEAIQRNLDLMIESVLNAQKGILQPQIESLEKIIEVLQKSVSLFPKDTMAPFTLSKDSAGILLRICDVHIYLRDGILGYIISLPLVNRGTFKAFRLIPLPIGIEQNKVVYTEPNEDILYVDQTRQYYFSTSREELRRCKRAQPNSYICKQNRPLLNSHMQESCAVKLLHPRTEIPKVCDIRIVKIEYTIWTQLEKRNEWVFFAPSSDSVTIICLGQEPVEIKLTGAGKLNIDQGCKGYSLTALLITKDDVKGNVSNKGGDLLSKIDSQFECCEQLGTSIHLSHLELDMKLKPIVTQLNDLKYASYIISELERLAQEHEWKNKHVQYHTTYSVLMYIVITVMGIYGLYRLTKFLIYRWYKCRKLRAITAATEQVLNLPAGASGTANVVNINIKTSNESLAVNPEAIPLKDFDESSEKDYTTELRRSRRVRAGKSHF
jgi:hypothetical protein